MPSYIELDQNTLFPSSSGAGKVIFGINNIGQAVTVNNAGVVLPISQSNFVSASYAVTASYALNAGGGGGGGTGLIIPKPIPYATKPIPNTYIEHTYNEPLSGPPGTTVDSWSTNMLKLTYQTSDLDFLNYNPKYFLFVYKGAKKYGPPREPQNPARLNNQKFGKYFAHPSNLSGSVGSGVTSVATYTNFSTDDTTSQFSSSFDKFTTEWNVATGSGHPTTLTGFDPRRFYFFRSGSGPDIEGIGYEFFPWPVAVSGSTNEFISVTSVKRFRKVIGVSGAGPKPRVNLYIKFAIVVDDPSNPGGYIIGPMSDTVKIYPAQGYFNNGESTEKYYYAWKTRLA